jgi:hypothetical protein
MGYYTDLGIAASLISDGSLRGPLATGSLSLRISFLEIIFFYNFLFLECHNLYI